MDWERWWRGSFGLLRCLAGEQGYVDVLEDLARRYAKNTVGGFDEIVAFATGVLSSENVGEGEAGGELLGFDQKAGTVGDPWVRRFHSVLSSRFSVSVSVLSSQRADSVCGRWLPVFRWLIPPAFGLFFMRRRE